MFISAFFFHAVRTLIWFWPRKPHLGLTLTSTAAINKHCFSFLINAQYLTTLGWSAPFGHGWSQFKYTCMNHWFALLSKTFYFAINMCVFFVFFVYDPPRTFLCFISVFIPSTQLCLQAGWAVLCCFALSLLWCDCLATLAHITVCYK